MENDVQVYRKIIYFFLLLVNLYPWKKLLPCSAGWRPYFEEDIQDAVNFQAVIYIICNWDVIIFRLSFAPNPSCKWKAISSAELLRRAAQSKNNLSSYHHPKASTVAWMGWSLFPLARNYLHSIWSCDSLWELES